MMTRYSMQSYTGSELRKKIDIKDNIIILKFEYGLWFISSFFLDSTYWSLYYHSVQFSCSVMSDSLQPHETQHARPPCPSPIPGVHPNPCPSSQWCHPPSHPLSSPSPPALNLSQLQGLFKWVSSSHQVAKVWEFQLQQQSFQWTPRTDLL